MVDWWPSRLVDADLTLRPLERADKRQYVEVRSVNSQWLEPWEATTPGAVGELPTFSRLRKLLNSAGKRGELLPYAIVVDGRFRGQLTVSGISWGSLRSASLGYWIDSRVAGRGYTPRAVALATDFCFFELGLHRMEINIRPENSASLRVVEKLGFRDEGVRKEYMHINGEWADHRTFALLSTEVPEGVLNRYRRNAQSRVSRE